VSATAADDVEARIVELRAAARTAGASEVPNALTPGSEASSAMLPTGNAGRPRCGVMTLGLVTFALAFAVLVATDLGATGAEPRTMLLGKGLGPHRIGMQRTIYPGLIRTIRQRENDSGGCSGSFRLDSYIDECRGLRLGYVLWNDDKPHLDVIATTTPGDRTTLGYTIGKSTFTDVRHRYPNARVSRHLGGSTLFVGHQTGYESGESLSYGFNANNRLVSLETSVGGC
jgi:hypothetical protein